MVSDEVFDLGIRERLGLRLGAITAARLLIEDHQTLADFLGRPHVTRSIEPTFKAPGMPVKAVFTKHLVAK